MEQTTQRILIVKPSSMGDIIHGLLIAEAIKTQLPEVSIDWVVRSEFIPEQAKPAKEHKLGMSQKKETIVGRGGSVELVDFLEGL